jgi:hypothetical protein
MLLSVTRVSIKDTHLARSSKFRLVTTKIARRRTAMPRRARPPWRHSQKAGGGSEGNDVRFWGRGCARCASGGFFAKNGERFTNGSRAQNARVLALPPSVHTTNRTPRAGALVDAPTAFE